MVIGAESLTVSPQTNRERVLLQSLLDAENALVMLRVEGLRSDQEYSQVPSWELVHIVTESLINERANLLINMNMYGRIQTLASILDARDQEIESWIRFLKSMKPSVS